MIIGESYIGAGDEAAHITTVLGDRLGPVGAAWATALATPRTGHAPFAAVLRPGVPVRPPTLVVSKAPVAGDRHAALTWGAAQAGVAGGVADALAQGVLGEEEARECVLIAAVWVSPAARDEQLVYTNNRAAVTQALRSGAAGEPQLAEVLAARDGPRNPYFGSR